MPRSRVRGWSLATVIFNWFEEIRRRATQRLRPARTRTPDHDPYAPGLHHFCFRVLDERAVDRAAAELQSAGVAVTDPRVYPAYAADYYATFFADPDGIRLEITNFREIRRRRMFDWDGV